MINILLILSDHLYFKEFICCNYSFININELFIYALKISNKQLFRTTFVLKNYFGCCISFKIVCGLNRLVPLSGAYFKKGL